MNANDISTVHRDLVIRTAIEQAIPKWYQWPFSSFNICPVNDAIDILDFEQRYTERNAAYRILHSYHCVDYFKIPKRILRAMPDLIREALGEKIESAYQNQETRTAPGNSMIDRRLPDWKELQVNEQIGRKNRLREHMRIETVIVSILGVFSLGVLAIGMIALFPMHAYIQGFVLVLLGAFILTMTVALSRLL